MPYKDYTDEDVIKFAAEVKSMAHLLRKLGKRPAGGNYFSMKTKLAKLSVDISHWTGQGWNVGNTLQSLSDYKRPSGMKNFLIKERGHSCEACGLSKWMGLSIILEMDHIDGDRTNNSSDNLRLLCPNCHSQTPTWRRRK